jgi:hypothetical protein
VDDDKYHINNLGMFGRDVPRDLTGFVYLTAEGWLNEADMDGEVTPEIAEELAARALEQTAAAEMEISEWRNED